MGHVEAEYAENIKTDDQIDDDQECPSQVKPKSIFTMDVDEQLEEALGEQAAMDARDEQLARTKEASDLDLESEMEKDMNTQATEGDDEKQQDPTESMHEMPDQESATTSDSNPRDPAQKSKIITTEAEIHESGYEKRYLTGPQDRDARTAARREQQRQKELKEQKEREEQVAKLARQAEEEEEGRKVVERALLQEETS